MPERSRAIPPPGGSAPSVAPVLEPHPWSGGFAWGRRRGPFARLTAAQVAHYDDEGWLLLEDAVDPDLLAAVTAAIDPFEDEVEEALRRRPDGRLFIAEAGGITFTTHLASRVPLLRRFASGPPFTELAHDLIGPDVRLYWDQAVYKKPERPRAFPVHQDNGYGFVEPQGYLTCWLALTDATPDNGCPRVFPGLHLRGTLRHRLEPAGFTLPLAWKAGRAVPVRAGSVLAFSSLTPHATGPNRSDAFRKAYILQYTPETAACLRGDPEMGPPSRREAVRDLPAAQQWPVLRAGRPVPAPGGDAASERGAPGGYPRPGGPRS